MPTNDPALLYLDLLSKTLTFMLWPEPPSPAMKYINKGAPFKNCAIKLSHVFLDRFDLLIARKPTESENLRTQGVNWPSYADTMIGLKRLENLQFCITTVLEDGVKGDLIETGVWRGGACIFMRGVLAAYGVDDRKVYVADSFEGLPEPDTDKFPVDQGDLLHTRSYLIVSETDVKNNFRRYGLLDDQVVFLKGWFKDTLPGLETDSFAVIRLDGDMYGSTMEALENLYFKLSSGGFCIVDDYVLPNCAQAVTDFREKYGITEKIESIDFTGVYWRKS